MINIVQKDNPVLRGKAEIVPVKEINTQKIQKIITDMKEALASQDDGVAIAAPQIDIPLQIFVVSKKVPLLLKNKELNKENLNGLKDTVYINPQITKLSKTRQTIDEGCLSVRYLYGQVTRSEKATVTAYDETGKKFTRGGSGLLAQIFQHEIDHLNGVLFTDKAENLQEILPPKDNA